MVSVVIFSWLSVGRVGMERQKTVNWKAQHVPVDVRVYTGLSKKKDGIWNRYNLKSTGRIYTFGVLKCSEELRVLDLP